MAMSAKKASTQSLVDFVTYVRANKGRITDMPPYDAVGSGHNARSWHKDKDGKYGQAADINYGPSGVSSEELAFFRRLLPVAQSYGLGVIHNYTGRGVGAANTHRTHMHVDVGSYSNHGNGDFKQAGGNRCVVRTQKALHQPANKRDNLHGSYTRDDIKVLRAASIKGGVKFPLGKKRAQRVCGVKQDNVWGNASRKGHDTTIRNLQAVWKAYGFYTGKIDGIWGNLMDRANTAYEKRY